jgi:signal transduction histidine kinase
MARSTRSGIARQVKRGENDGGDVVSPALSENGFRAQPAPRRWFPRLRDTRIRAKLALILVVPLAAVLVLAATQLVAAGRSAYDASTARSLTALSVKISALTQDLHRERMAGAMFLASPTAQADSYNQQVQSTDQQIAAYNAERRNLGGVPAAVQTRLRVIDEHLLTINGLRQAVLDRKQMTVAEVVLRYGVILTDLVSYGEALGQLPGQTQVADSRRAVAAFARAKAAVADEEAVAFAALSAGQLDKEQFTSFLATQTRQQEALVAFSLAGTSQQQAVVDQTVTGDAVVLADRAAADVARSVGQQPQIKAADAATAVGAVTDLMRWAEIQLEQQLLAQADQVQAAAIRDAVIESLLLLLVLAVAIALAVVLARSLNDSLRRLREGALAVASHDLPDAVSRLRDVDSIGAGGVEEIVRQVRDPIRLANRDEIGQVAQAFNVVHREAVRVAAEQAALRASVSAMFLNLARRSQTLVDRMIGELDQIERGEEDPKRLAQLFELDHLATRMRRNDENLLVLAGADSAVPRRDDALLVDVLRAAQSEVELYNRIEFGTVDTDVAVAAHAVNDVVRLLAELLDNATRFSPPKTIVVADARRIRDYLIIQVEDHGLGLSDEQLEALNRRLAAPAAVDVASFRLMGLAVVSRLAARYSIRVELRRNVEGGTVAQVTLPSATVVLPRGRGHEQTLTRPRQPLAVESAPAIAAAFSSTRPDSMAAIGARRSAAALVSDQWRDTRPAQWQVSADQRGTAVPVNAVVQTPPAQVPSTTPTSPASAPAVPASGHPADRTHAAEVTASTAAYPMVAPLPQRGAGSHGTSPAMPHPGPPLAPGTGLPYGPVAGTPATPGPVGTPAPTGVAGSAASRHEEGGEMPPIFREMEAVWFRTHGQEPTAIFTMPTAGHRPPATAAGPTRVVATAVAPAASVQPAGTVPGAGTPGGTQPPAGSTLPARVPGQRTPPLTQPPYPSPAATSTPGAVPPQPAGAAPAQQPYVAAGQTAWRTAADEGWALASRAAEPTTTGTTRSGLPKRVPQAQLVPGGVAAATSGPDRTRRTPDEVRGLLSAYHRGVQRGRSAGRDSNGTTSTKETSG